MEKKTFLFVILSIILGGKSFDVYAQNDIPNSNLITDPSWYIDGIRRGWYVTLGGGVQTIFADDDYKESDLLKRTTFAPSLTVGKYFSPSWGLRMQITGGSLHGFNDGAGGFYRKWMLGDNANGQGFAGTAGYPANIGPDFTTWDPQWERLGFSLNNGQIRLNSEGRYEWIGAKDGKLYMQHLRYVAVNMGFMFDLFSTLRGYDPNRRFEITPLAGIAYAYVFSHHNSPINNTLGANVGVNFKSKLNEKFDLNIEANMTVYPDDFDGHIGNRDNDVVGQALVGITYRIDNGVQPVKHTEDGRIQELNSKINELRARLENIPPCPPLIPSPAPEPQTIVIKYEKFDPYPVFFQIDKYEIQTIEWTKIERTAQYLERNPDIKIKIVGYADAKTAYPKYNYRLSEHRVKAVRDAFVDKYNIDSSRMALDWEGDTVQPFGINELNRTVLIMIDE